MAVKQVISSQCGSSLLDYAISKLNAEVFSHPVWVRFGKKEEYTSPSIIDDLLSAAKSLVADDPGNACQVLLICAVYQNSRGERYQALKTAQQALTLAERNSLWRETIWAIWGESAIHIQEKDYEMCESSLVNLQAVLSQQNEWILADLIEVLRQVLRPYGTTSAARDLSGSQTPTLGDPLSVITSWLQHWGFTDQVVESQFEVIPAPTADHPLGPLSQLRRWLGRWHSFILAFRGELRLQWGQHEVVGTNEPTPSGDSNLSSWGFRLPTRNIEMQRKDEIPQIPERSAVTSAEKPPRPKNASRKKKSASKPKKANKNEAHQPATTVTLVAVHMLGAFRVTIGDLEVKLATSRGVSLLKYLLLNHRQPVSREVLMDAFWPDAEPETARNNLNVAMYSLRKALRAAIFLPVIVFEDGMYGLERNLQVWLDVEEFEQCVKAGQQLEVRDQLTAAVTEYESAISLYQGDFLEQNPYEEWTVLDRERLRIAYLDMLDRLSQIYFNQEHYAQCIAVCQLTLARDRCREDAHCLLMRSYSRQGQHHLAFRQYQICVDALRAELDVEASFETTQLYEQIRRRAYV